VSDDQPNPQARPAVEGRTLIAAGLLLGALAMVVLYTNQGSFLNPIALVVVAAIGAAALMLQRHLRPSLSSQTFSARDRPLSARAPLWLNALGVAFGLAALCANLFHRVAWTLFAALAAVISFAASGVILIRALRKTRL
jgi:hypothetical protein